MPPFLSAIKVGIFSGANPSQIFARQVKIEKKNKKEI